MFNEMNDFGSHKPSRDDFDQSPIVSGLCNSWAAVAGAAVGVIGGAMSANAAKGAAATQAAAAGRASDQALQTARESNQLQAELYKSGLAQVAPYQQGGQLALSALMSGMGLGPARSSLGTDQGGVAAPQSRPGMAPAGGANAGVTDTTGMVSPQGAMTTAPAGSYVNVYGQAVDAQGNPIISSDSTYGVGGVNYGATQSELNQAAGSVTPGQLSSNFTMNDLLTQLDPGYQFRLEQGNQALAARRSATGNRFGGQALKDIQDYGQGLASTETQNAYNRYVTNQNNLFNRLSSIAGLGSSSGQQAQQAGLATGQSMGNTMTGAAGQSGNYLTSGAAAQAAGQVGATNALVGGANTGLNNWYSGRWNSALQNGMNSPSGGTTATTSGTTGPTNYSLSGSNVRFGDNP